MCSSKANEVIITFGKSIMLGEEILDRAGAKAGLWGLIKCKNPSEASAMLDHETADDLPWDTSKKPSQGRYTSALHFGHGKMGRALILGCTILKALNMHPRLHI